MYYVITVIKRQFTTNDPCANTIATGTSGRNTLLNSGYKLFIGWLYAG